MGGRSGKPRRICQVCGRGESADLQPGVMVRSALGDIIKSDIGSWDDGGWICAEDLKKYRHRYIEGLLAEEKGELTTIEREVLESLREQEIISRNPDMYFEADLTPGQRVADKIASFGGSWSFIISFMAVVVFWMLLNSFILLSKPFDPYPYILLNLVLSCVAAIQAPVIMMSQNRQESRDRARALSDYQVNLKAELEIRHLTQKLDHIMSRQWERLVEVQELQMELLDELRGEKAKEGKEK